MTTAADLIQETRGYLLSGYREQLNRLNGAHDASTTTFTFREIMGGIRAGVYLSVDLEIVYVWSADEANSTAVVQRGMNGSTAASHADNAIITLNPKFPDFKVLQAINNDLKDLTGRGLFQVRQATPITYIAGRSGYDLVGVSSIISGINVRYDHPGSERDWPELRQWKIRRDSDLSDFPSGFSLILMESAHPGMPIRVTYSAPYASLSSLTDDVLAVTGLQTDGHDIPPLGAAFRLESVREPQRNFNESQPGPRRGDEIRAGDQITAARGLLALRETRIRSLMTLLNKQYPNRRNIK